MKPTHIIGFVIVFTSILWHCDAQKLLQRFLNLPLSNERIENVKCNGNLHNTFPSDDNPLTKTQNDPKDLNIVSNPYLFTKNPPIPHFIDVYLKSNKPPSYVNIIEDPIQSNNYQNTNKINGGEILNKFVSKNVPYFNKGTNFSNVKSFRDCFLDNNRRKLQSFITKKKGLHATWFRSLPFDKVTNSIKHQVINSDISNQQVSLKNNENLLNRNTVWFDKTGKRTILVRNANPVLEKNYPELNNRFVFLQQPDDNIYTHQDIEKINFNLHKEPIDRMRTTWFINKLEKAAKPFLLTRNLQDNNSILTNRWLLLQQPDDVFTHQGIEKNRWPLINYYNPTRKTDFNLYKEPIDRMRVTWFINKLEKPGKSFVLTRNLQEDNSTLSNRLLLLQEPDDVLIHQGIKDLRWPLINYYNPTRKTDFNLYKEPIDRMRTTWFINKLEKAAKPFVLSRNLQDNNSMLSNHLLLLQEPDDVLTYQGIEELQLPLINYYNPTRKTDFNLYKKPIDRMQVTWFINKLEKPGKSFVITRNLQEDNSALNNGLLQPDNVLTDQKPLINSYYQGRTNNNKKRAALFMDTPRKLSTRHLKDDIDLKHIMPEQHKHTRSLFNKANPFYSVTKIQNKQKTSLEDRLRSTWLRGGVSTKNDSPKTNAVDLLTPNKRNARSINNKKKDISNRLKSIWLLTLKTKPIVLRNSLQLRSTLPAIVL